MSLTIETLIKEKKFINRWYPKPVDVYRASIKVRGVPKDNALILNNFAYSMQYIEFLEKQIDEFKLSEVLSCMTYKSYIVTGIGIIEGLFTNLLKETGNWNMSSWKEISIINSNPKKIIRKKIKVETILYEEVDSFPLRMDLDSMIKRIESRNLLSINHDVFPALKQLRELRNRVHIQIGDKSSDHDYNNFGFEEIQMMRRILLTILTCEEFCINDVYDFLKPKQRITG